MPESDSIEEKKERLKELAARLASEAGPRTAESWREELDYVYKHCRFLKCLLREYKSRQFDMQAQLNSDQSAEVIERLCSQFEYHAIERAKKASTETQ